MFTLLCKLLRDVRVSLIVVMLLLAGFQCLWVKVTALLTGDVVPYFALQMGIDSMKSKLSEGPLKIVQTMMGGESIELERAMDILSIGYVHPLMQIIFCVWAIGRASGAVAGEIDRGTMELLLAQPIARYRVILAHLWVDCLTIPLLCLSLWGGTWLGAWLVGPIEVNTENVKLPFPLRARPVPAELLSVNPAMFGPALWNVAALLFAVSGYTLFLSARGRFRNRVLGVAVVVTLVQFLVNVIGQLWDAVGPLRPFTVFYYYQPQQIVLRGSWTVDLGKTWNLGQALPVNVLVVLTAIGLAGYGLALWKFCRRDLPAPL